MKTNRRRFLKMFAILGAGASVPISTALPRHRFAFRLDFTDREPLHFTATCAEFQETLRATLGGDVPDWFLEQAYGWLCDYFSAGCPTLRADLEVLH